MSRILKINRRLFLEGAGVMIALPLLESFGRARAPYALPTRFCFIYTPNGMEPSTWMPQTVGPLAVGNMPELLTLLKDHRDYITVASGLHNLAADEHGKPEEYGQHARSVAAYLSAVYPSQPTKDTQHAGESIDTLLSRKLPGGRVPLLNLATELAERYHDKNWSEVWNYSMSWQDENRRVKPIIRPEEAFRKLCGDSRGTREGEPNVANSRPQDRSVL